MHPLDQMCAHPEVAATFKWLDPPNDEGRPRRWRIVIPREIFDAYAPYPTWLGKRPVPRQRKIKGDAAPDRCAPNAVAV